MVDLKLNSSVILASLNTKVSVLLECDAVSWIQGVMQCPGYKVPEV
jgi:hypothetical protein